MGLSMSSTNFEQQHLSSFLSYPSHPFVRPPAEPILSSRPAASWARRAQGRSRMAVAKSFIYAQPFPGHSLMDPEHGGRLGHVGINGAVIRWAFASKQDKTI